MMALARTFWGVRGDRLNLTKALSVCAVGVLASYMLTVFAPHPILSLVGCALCGLFVGIYWPGSLSAASRRLPLGGTTMFAALALAGDLGCALGPGMMGFIPADLGLKAGFLAACVFPVTAFAILRILAARDKKR